MIELALLLAGFACIRHGYRGLRRDMARWADRKLRRIARTDLREWYWQEP